MKLQPSKKYKILNAIETPFHAKDKSLPSDDNGKEATIQSKYSIIPLKLNQDLLKNLQKQNGKGGSSDLALEIVLDAESNDLVLEYGGQTVALLPQDGHGKGNGGPLWNCAEMHDQQFSSLGSIECGKWSMPPSAMIGSRIKQSTDEEKRVKQGRSSMFLESEPSKIPSHSLSRGGIKKKPTAFPVTIKPHSIKSPLGSLSPHKKSPPIASVPIEETKFSASTKSHNTPRTSSNRSLSIESLEAKLLHILACRPADVDDCVMKTSSSHDQVLSILQKIGCPQASNPKLFQLKTESYKLLNPWLYESYTPQERTKAIRNAAIAFDTLKLPKDSKERKVLVPPPGMYSKANDLNSGVERMGSSTSSLSSLSPRITPATLDNSTVNANGSVRIKRKISDSSTTLGETTVKIRKRNKSDDLTGNNLPNIVEANGNVAARKRTSSGLLDAIPITTPKKINNVEQSSRKQALPPLMGRQESSQGKSVSQLLKPNLPLDPIMDASSSAKKFLEFSDWKQLSVTNLSKYLSYLFARKNHLTKKLTSVLKVGNDISLLLDPTLGSSLTSKAPAIKSENQKLALIKSRIMKAGFQASPSSFITTCDRIKQSLQKVRTELESVQTWIQENGGTVMLDSIDE